MISTNVLYHFLKKEEDLKKILEEDCLKPCYTDCVSFTRCKYLFSDWRKIKLVLDRRTLNYDYKIFCHNHYYFEYRELTSPPNEMEERVRGEIKNLSKYLIRIEINNEINK